MLYTLFKYLMRFALRSYFKIIKISGYKNVPTQGPTIFVANHPSTLLDPIVIATMLPRIFYFLAAEEFMSKGMLKWILRHWIHMIPVYRPSNRPEDANKNKDVFEMCYARLAKGGSILIFPEGSSESSKRLRPLKTGTARMALASYKLTGVPVKIAPIGLNYSDSHSFQSNLFISVAPPISTDDPKIQSVTDDFEKAKLLTTTIENSLKANLIHVEDESLDAFFKKVTFITNHLPRNANEDEASQKEIFALDKEIQEGMHFYAANKPEVVESLSRKLDTYIQRAKFYGITETSISTIKSNVSWGDYFRIIFGIPVFVFGFLANSIPYYATIWLFRKLKVSHAFQGSIAFSIGLIFFLAWYISLGVIANNITGLWWMGVLLPVFCYITGKFALTFLSLAKSMNEKGILLRIWKRNRNVIKSLYVERSEILKEMKMYGEEYRSSLQNQVSESE